MTSADASKKGSVSELKEAVRQEAAVDPQALSMVPTVTDEKGRGYDIFSLMLKKRTVFLQGKVNESMAAVARASLLYLASLDRDAKIKVIVDSGGGNILAGTAIYDTMMNLEAGVEVVGNGQQMSMGSILLCAGNGIVGCKSMMTENAWLMLHGPSGGSQGPLEGQKIDVEFTERLGEQMIDIYVKHTGLTHEFWDVALRVDTFLNPRQALEIGFINEIIRRPEHKKTLHEKFCHRARPSFCGQKINIPDSPAKIIALLGSTLHTRHRPDLVVALSKFPKFWTPARRQATPGTGKPAKKKPSTGPKT